MSELDDCDWPRRHCTLKAMLHYSSTAPLPPSCCEPLFFQWIPPKYVQLVLQKYYVRKKKKIILNWSSRNARLLLIQTQSLDIRWALFFFFYLLKHNFILSPGITCHFSKLWGVFYKLTCCSHMEINASLCWYNNIPTGEQQLNSLLSLLVVWLPVKLGSKRWNEFGNLNSRRDKRTHIMVQLVEKERENCLHKQER